MQFCCDFSRAGSCKYSTTEQQKATPKLLFNRLALACNCSVELTNDLVTKPYWQIGEALLTKFQLIGWALQTISYIWLAELDLLTRLYLISLALLTWLHLIGCTMLNRLYLIDWALLTRIHLIGWAILTRIHLLAEPYWHLLTASMTSARRTPSDTSCWRSLMVCLFLAFSR